VQRNIYGKILTDKFFSKDMSQGAETCAVLQYRKILLKFLDPDLEVDDFQNLVISSLSTISFTSFLF